MKTVARVGVLSMIAGMVFIVAGVVAWIVITSNLSDEEIVVAEDASFLGGDEVNGPFSAFAQAQVINKHAMEATGGLTYAELGDAITEAEDAGDDDQAAELQEQRSTQMTASFLRASLFTSVVAYGVAALVVGSGLLLLCFGAAFRALATRSGAPAGTTVEPEAPPTAPETPTTD